MKYRIILKYGVIIFTICGFTGIIYGERYPENDCHFLYDDTISCCKKESPQPDSLQYYTVNGIITDNFHENLDGVSIIAELNSQVVNTKSDSSGFFTLNFMHIPGNLQDVIHLNLNRYDLKPYDTLVGISLTGVSDTLNFILLPRYKILLKGRLFAGCSNTPLEDADITVRYRNEIKKVKTLSCYTDEENYWNCLYLGIFKTEIVTDDPEDTVYLSFSKTGFRNGTYNFRFADYPGDLLRFRLKYADTLSDLPSNNMCFKLAYPLGKNSGWYLGFSFYGSMRYDWLKRLKPGFELTMASYKHTQSLNTLPGIYESEFDTTYTTFLAGPSFLFYLTKPNIRKFSTYLGSTFSLALDGGEFIFQPFVGTRFFLDMRKSLSLDIRYISYNQDVKKYTYMFNGNARYDQEEVRIRRISIGIGLQINF